MGIATNFEAVKIMGSHSGSIGYLATTRSNSNFGL